MPSDVAVLVAAAGSGSRLGDVPKALLRADGQTLVERVEARFAPFSRQILFGVRPQDLADIEALIDSDHSAALPGGSTRQETIELLLSRCDRPLVVIHDVARPHVQAELIERVLAAATEHGAVAPCGSVPVRDSVGLRQGDSLVEMVDRHRLVSVQTPYAVRRDWLLDAYEQAARYRWDETSTMTLLIRAGYTVHLVDGQDDNIKITYIEDLDGLGVTRHGV